MSGSTGADDSPAVFGPMKSATLRDRIAHQLICAVLRGTFVPGQLLPPEEALCEQFQVSRPVVREAMKTLVSIGMVRTRQGQGSVLLEDSSWNDFAPELLLARCDSGQVQGVLEEVLEMRAVLEVRAAELAARHATPDDVSRLSDHLVAMKASTDSTERFLAHDLAFHKEIVRLSGNRLIFKLLELLEPMLISARSITLEHQPLPSGMLSGISEHEQILEAIATGSSELVGTAMARHLSWVSGRVVNS
jgi:DNA-binding FadR family transcriptional regulator